MSDLDWSDVPDRFSGFRDLITRELKIVEDTVEWVQTLDSIPELRERRKALREQISELEDTLDGHMNTPVEDLPTRILRVVRRKMNLRTHLEVVNRELQRRLDPTVMLQKPPSGTPFERYCPSDTVRERLLKVAEKQDERDLYGASDRRKVLKIVLDDPPDEPLAALRQHMPDNIYPDTVEDLIDLALQYRTFAERSPND